MYVNARYDCGPERGCRWQLRIYASEPAFLVPTAADDDPAIQVIRQLYRGLVTYNSETGAAENDIAESITSTDNTTWTIKIKPGYKFTNGEAVNSDSFIRGVELHGLRPERPEQRLLHEPHRRSRRRDRRQGPRR